MSIMVATGKAATQGVLFRDAAAIENFRTVNTLIVDKTGTLTDGKPRFDRSAALSGYSENEMLRLAASLALPSHRMATLADDRRSGHELKFGVGYFQCVAFARTSLVERRLDPLAVAGFLNSRTSPCLIQPIDILVYAWQPRGVRQTAVEAGVGSTVHCVAGDATGAAVAAVVTALVGLPMWAPI